MLLRYVVILQTVRFFILFPGTQYDTLQRGVVIFPTYRNTQHPNLLYDDDSIKGLHFLFLHVAIDLYNRALFLL